MLTARRPLEAPPKLDVYTGMLTASLAALGIAGVLLFIDYSSYPTPKPVEPAAPETIKAKPVTPATTPTVKE